MTISLCLAICRKHKFRYSGLKKRFECHCGNEPSEGFHWAWPDKCRMRCGGDSTQTCGGWDVLSIWTTPKNYLNGLCVYDFPENRRALQGFSQTGIQNLTIEYCRDLCSGKFSLKFII